MQIDLVTQFGEWIVPYEGAIRAILILYKQQNSEMRIQSTARDEAVVTFRLENPTGPVLDTAVCHTLRTQSSHFTELCTQVEAEVRDEVEIDYTLSNTGCPLYNHTAPEHTSEQKEELARILKRMQVQLELQGVETRQSQTLLDILAEYVTHRVEVLPPEKVSYEDHDDGQTGVLTISPCSHLALNWCNQLTATTPVYRVQLMRNQQCKLHLEWFRSPRSKRVRRV